MTFKKESFKREPNPVLKASLLSRLLFFWTRHIFRKGFRQQLESHHLYENIPYLNSEEATNKFAEEWNYELRNKKPNLLRAIFLAYGWKILYPCLIYSAIKIVIDTLQPLFLAGLLSYFSPGQRIVSKNNAYFNAAFLVISNFLVTFVYNYYMFHTATNGIRIRLACSGLIYRKCLKFPITNCENGDQTGLIFSAIFKDLPQLDTTFQQTHNLWKAPIESILFAYVMWREIGWMSILGIPLIYAFIPLQIWAVKTSGYCRNESAKFGDERCKIMNEVITAIEVIKMYALESCFAKIIANVRKSELKYIRGAMRIYAGIQCTDMISKFALILSLTCYVYTGKLITASKIFMAATYYVALSKSLLWYWTLAMTNSAEAIVCLKRVNKFLLMEDSCAGKRHAQTDFKARNLRKEIKLCNVSTSWDEMPAQNEHIRHITCNLVAGQFVGVVGAIGAGKSTFINAILGELKITQGRMNVNGSISYASQEPWLFEGTIRQNIVFVEPYDEKRYKAVLQVCELESDLRLLKCGDASIVSDRGCNLSGGQKARINLARAVYKKADIYLLDDPLSAVDTIVGSRLIEKCLLKFLEPSIRVLVTHHVEYIIHANHIIVMDDGSIKSQGTFGALKHLIRHQSAVRRKISMDVIPKSKLLRSSSTQSMKFELGENFDKVEENLNDRKEYQMDGSVRSQVYIDYLKAFKYPLVVCSTLALFALTRACRGVMDVYLSKWATLEDFYYKNIHTKANESYERKKMLAMYALLIVCSFLLHTLQTFGFLTICLRISTRLHNLLYSSVIRAYMIFFQSNPSGRILNRFSNDLWRTDMKLPQALVDSFSFFAEITTILCIVGMTNYWLLLPAAVMLILLNLTRALYLRSARNLQRLESITCSPLYTHVNQTFQGLTTIRALKATHQLEFDFHDHQNLNTSAVYLSMVTSRAFALWTDVLCGFYISLVCFSFLLFERNFNSGEVGLAISQSSMLLVACQWGIRRTAETESFMTSVERIMEYVDTPKEPDTETSETVGLPLDWPSKGLISFTNVRLRYCDTKLYVLKGISFTIRPGEKIGIVGRTGAGKSSIIQALFRLAILEGRIEIDGFDISRLGLNDLRSRLSIIPQEPVLFTGSLRFNLDPLGELSDDELWRALDDVELKLLISSSEGGLDCYVHESGANFSIGQRQLICLARAILRRNKVVVMDEATANVDLVTDKLIQETIRTKFSQCTVITIAHRLHTVMDCDRIMVINDGRVVDMDHPHLLLQKRRGHLYKMVEKMGYEMSEQLKRIAEESFQSRLPKVSNQD